MMFHPQQYQGLIEAALAEDVGRGDLTGDLLIDELQVATVRMVAREPLVVCGLPLAAQVFYTMDSSLQCSGPVSDGQGVESQTPLLEVQGNARAILAAERTALNLFSRLCAVASYTRQFVKAVEGTGAVILDTRKTLPGYRDLEKYAVRMGGAQNHRMRLDDGVLIKDNHIALCGGIAKAIERARANTPVLTKIEVECDTLQQVSEAVQAGADMILLDNMDLGQLKEAVALVAGKIPLEASGNVTLETVRSIAETGVNYISAGRLTHSAPNVDIGLDVVMGS